MTAPERIEGRPEGGWIVTGQCGRPHLTGRRYTRWRCPICTHPGWRARTRRHTSAARLAARQRGQLGAWYPGDPT